MGKRSNKDYVYDCEVYPNYFCIAIEELHGDRTVFYEISEWKNQRDQLENLLTWFKDNRKRMIGYNSNGFDYPVLHTLLHATNNGMSGSQIASILHRKAKAIIDAPFHDKFTHLVWDRDQMVKQIDIFKIHHFDNQARRTGLKELEFNMHLDRIQELPIEPNTIVTREEAYELGDYCLNSDVSATKKFALETVEMIKFREKLKKEFPKISINDSDSKIGSNILIQELESRLGETICFEKVNGKRTPRGTFRDGIVLNDIIFDYIHFDRPEFNALLSFLKTRTLHETKEVFEKIPTDELGDLKNYANGIVTDKKTEVEYVKKLNVVVDGFQFDIGTGGCHACIPPAIVLSDEEYVIIDLDVKGFYPEVAIKNGLYPEHLTSEFVPIYDLIVKKKDNAAKGSMEKGAYKLAANASYGNSNSQYSPFFDPQFTMSITMNGQLLLCMLSEKLMEIPSVTMIQVNTDGVTVKIKRDDMDLLKTVWADWEEMSNLILEENIYSRMMIINVNNYIAEYDTTVHPDEKPKLKGLFNYKLGWHQNHSNLVSRKAAVEHLLHGTDIETFIRTHFQQSKNGKPDNLFDFFLRTKISRSFVLIGAVNDPVTFEAVSDTYKSLDIQSRLILEEKGFSEFERAHRELVETGKCVPTKTIKSHDPIGKLLDIKPKVAKAGYQAYLKLKESGTSEEFPSTVIREEQQRITRYFASNEGVSLFKIMPPVDGKISNRYNSIDAGFALTEVNNMRPIDRSEVDFNYYVRASYKLLKGMIDSSEIPKRKRRTRRAVQPEESMKFETIVHRTRRIKPKGE